MKRNFWTTKVTAICPACGQDIYSYDDDECDIHGIICKNCVVKCEECRARRCPKCVVEYDGMKFCHAGCIDKYKSRSIKVVRASDLINEPRRHYR